MTRRPILLGALALLAAVSLQACSRAIRPPAPKALPATPDPPAPELPVSVIEVPVRYGLTAAIEELERAVPARIDHWARYIRDGNVRYKYKVWRDAFDVDLDGDRVTIGTRLRYKAQAQARVLRWLPPRGLGCGSEDSPRRFDVAYTSVLALAPEWRVLSTTTVSELSAVDRCRIGPTNYDVTRRIEDALRGVLERGAEAVDGEIRALDLSTPVQTAWRRLQEPISLGDGVWLAMRPISAGLWDLSFSGTALEARIGLSAAPGIVAGRRPEATTRPLPPLDRSRPAGSGFRLVVLGELDYETAGGSIRAAVRGSRFGDRRRQVELTDAAIRALGGNRVVVQVDFKGDARGTVFFTATPRVDPEAEVLSLPDLDYDVETRNLLVRGADWLLRDDIRDFLRSRAVWSTREVALSSRRRLEQAVNRDLGDGVRLAGTVSSLRLLDARAGDGFFRVWIEAEGDVGADLGPAGGASGGA